MIDEGKKGYKERKQTIGPSKPRNFVAKNATAGGAGAHKDKKKAMKQGEVKHKTKELDMAESEKKTMSRAAKGHEKYGKAGMQALAKAGRDGASEEKLDTIRKKYNKYDESTQESWSQKYKNSINCSHPKGFSQRAHCQGKKKHNESIEMESVCPDCGMCETHGDNMMEVKQRLDAKCWKGKHKEGTKIKGGIRVNNCVPNESVAEGQGDFDQAINNLHGWYEVGSSNPDLKVYDFDDREGGFYADGRVMHNIKTGRIKIKFEDRAGHYGDDIDQTFNSIGDAMNALRTLTTQINYNTGKAQNFDRLGGRDVAGPKDLYKTDRAGKKGTISKSRMDTMKMTSPYRKTGPKGTLPEGLLKEDIMGAPPPESNHEAGMALSELYRNAKYGMALLKIIEPNDAIDGWVQANLTNAADMLDKVGHYLDYKNINGRKPKVTMEEEDDNIDDTEPSETDGSMARENLEMIVEYSIRLMEMIKPGDNLASWVSMKLTKASEAISSAKHFIEYRQFEKHAGDAFESKLTRMLAKELTEVSLGDYSKKAKLSQASAGMQKFFNRDDPEKVAGAEKTIAKREKGLARSQARADKFGQQLAAKQQAAADVAVQTDKENLPDLIKKYQKLRSQFDPNFEYSDDHRFWSEQRGIRAQLGALERRINAAGGNV